MVRTVAFCSVMEVSFRARTSWEEFRLAISAGPSKVSNKRELKVSTWICLKVPRAKTFENMGLEADQSGR